MRRTAALAGIACATLALGTSPLAALAAPAPVVTPSAAGSYIVVLEDTAAARTTAAAHAERFGLDLGHVYTSAVRGYSATMPAGVADLVAAAPAVDFVQRDTAVRATAQSTPTGIDRAEADTSPTAAIDGTDQRVDVDVAVIDTGADLTHPDLNIYRAGARTAPSARSAPTTSTATAPTCPARSVRSTTAPGWSAWPRAPGSGRSRCSPTPAPG